MNHLTKLVLLIASLLISVGVVQATKPVNVNKRYVRFTERIRDYSPVFQNRGLQPKGERLADNKGGSIVLLYDGTLPDSIQSAFNAAKRLWEARLITRQPIIISVDFESLGAGIAMAADAACLAKGDLKGCPCALASQINNRQEGSVYFPDGRIILNSDVDWNCSFSKDATSEYNIPTIMLRGIARCLGFGTSLFQDLDNKFYYSYVAPSYFDRLLYNGNEALSDLMEGSAAMADFVTSNDVEARTPSGKYGIYAPEEYDPYMSLSYFKDPNSLMSYHLGKGNIDLTIDDSTLDVLEAVGWNLLSSSLKIKCNDIPDDGIGSSYSSHVFSLSKGNESVTRYEWRFLLKDRQGFYTLVSSGGSETFTVSAISSPDNYLVNIDGDLEGLIECDYMLNGGGGGTATFPLSLELKPVIHSIDDIRIVSDEPYAFSVLFNVHYSGSDKVTVEIEEEYDTTLRNYRFDEPYIAHVKTGKMSNLYYSWVTVIVKNRYGSVYETLEYAPTMGGEAIHDSSRHSELNSLNINTIKEIRLYDVNGGTVFSGTQADFVGRAFKSGIYIKEERYEDGTTKITKTLL